ncbi:MAG: DHA2 family efflux MFS transporter permease subunit [Burkholderiaceae bacterium]
MASRTHDLPPLQGANLVVGTIVLSLASFMTVLDTSIANVAIPAISGDLGVSPTQGTWVITSFAVATAIMMPLTGWLTQRIGQVRLFVGSTLLFTLASLLCGLATNIESLILFRILQGAVAGPMIPLSQSLLLASYPKARAGFALSMWGMTSLVAPVCGPIFGGVITDNIAWSWIFYINVPVGLLSALITWRLYRDRETPTRRLPIDRVGLALLVIWVGATQVMLEKGKELDWFASGQVIVLGAVALVGFILFIIWELTDEHPIIDLSLFTDRNFLIGTIAVSIGYGVFFANVVLLPLWLQQWMGYNATWAGLVSAPVGILAILVSPLVGKYMTVFDTRKIVTVAFIGFAAVLWMRSQFNTQADPQTILLPILLQGLFMPTFFIPMLALTVTNLPQSRVPAATGLTNFIRLTAGAVGTSITTTTWENRAAIHHAHISERLTQDNLAFTDAMAELEQQGFSREQGLAYFNRLVDQQAFTLSVDEIFLMSAVLFALMIPLIWIARPVSDSPAQ